MKLLSISLRNLNALYDEHTVDFVGELGDPPLFLIVGPTGAGKSTLLDAVCLALFGQTPRLSGKSPANKDQWESTTDPRHVISRGRGSAFAQVVFERSDAGRRVQYRATWECQRARQQADGRFSAKPRRSLARRDPDTLSWSDMVSSEQPTQYDECFDKVLDGMTVQDFKRCMLLAQGEFTAFLRASDDERAAILERLTDTSEYRALGQRANERRAAADSSKRQFESERATLDDVSDAVFATAEREVERTELEQSRHRALVQSLADLLAWTRHDVALAHALEELRAVHRATRDELLRNAADFESLARHDQLAEAVAPLSELDRLDGEIRALADQRSAEEVDLLRLAEQLSLAHDDERSARERLALLSAKAAALDPSIAHARSLRATHAQLVQILADARVALTTAADERTVRHEARFAAEQSLTAATVRFEEAVHALSRVSVDRPLLDARAGLHARFDEIERRRAEFERLQGSIASGRLLCADLAVQHDVARSLVEQRRAVLAPLRDRHASAQGALAQCIALDPSSTAQRARHRVERERTSERGRALDALATTVAELEGHRSSHEATRVRVETTAREVVVARQLLDAADAACTELERALESTKTRRRDLDWFAGLARERHRLEDGRACPLCGSTDHPDVRSGRHADVDREVRERFAAVETDLLSLEQRVADALAARDRRSAEKDTCEVASTVARRDVEHLDARIAGMHASIDEQRDRVARSDGPATLEDCVALLERLRLAENALDAAELTERESARDLRAAEHDCTEAETRLGRVELDRRAAEVGLHGNDARADASRAELERLVTQLEGDLRTFALEGSSLGDTLRIADQRCLALEKSVADSDAARSMLADADRAADAARLQDEHAAAGHETAAARVAEFDVAERERAAQVLAALDGKDPDEVERALREDTNRARADHEDRSRSFEQVSLAHARTVARLDQSKALLATMVQHRHAAFQRVMDVSTRVGAGDLAALRSALLPPERAAALTLARAAVKDAVLVAEGRERAASEQVQRHRSARPAGGDASPGDLATLEAGLREAELSQGEIDRSVADARAHLVALRERRARLASLDERGAEARREAELWGRLHDLIGRNDGMAFVRFAQSLNLADLVERANEQLERLAPRYRLAPLPVPEGADPGLGLAVMDTWQAGQLRPLGTLSGGESFLVSLSLALALASVGSARVPIETLLLDEGFGTLDSDTLQTVMNALASLNARGIQVGIISHVPALKERIDARIVIEPIGVGRSRVRVETSS